MAFHVGEHRDERAVQRLIDGGNALLVKARLEHLPQAERHIGVLGGIFGRLVERNAIEGDLLLAGAGDLLERDRRVVEIALGQLIHAVPMHAGVEGEGEQHRIVNGRERDAVAGEDRIVVLDVLADLEDGLVFQKGFQRLQGFGLVDLARRVGIEHVAAACMVRIDVAERDVAGLIRCDGDGDSDEIAKLAVEAVCLGIDSDDTGIIGAGDPVFQRLEIAHANIVFLVEANLALGWLFQHAFGLERLADAARDRAKLHLLEEFDQRHRVRVADSEVFERGFDGHVVIKLDQLFRDADLIGKIDQGLAALGLFDLFGVREQFLDRAVLSKQCSGGLHANAGGPGDVIGAVAGEGLHIDNLFRPDAKLLIDRLDAEMLALHRVEHGDLVGDKLHQILVGGDNGDARALGFGLAGIGRDQIIGLEAFHFEGMAGKGDGSFAHQRELRPKVFRRLVAIGLVVGVEVVAEGVAALVEDAGEVGRALVTFQLFEQLPEHVAEASHRADRQAVRRPAERRQGVKGAEDIGARIDQVEMAVFIDGR